jgi:hypothetical protein
MKGQKKKETQQHKTAHLQIPRTAAQTKDCKRAVFTLTQSFMAPDCTQ